MITKNSYYTQMELMEIGFQTCGNNVLISRKVSFYNPEKMKIGNNVRIDDFCILSGKITLCDYIHIAAFNGLFGASAGIEFSDFSTISARGCIYASTDDYSGDTMTNPMVSFKYRGVREEKVFIGKHCIIGTNTTILPGAIIGEGCSVGACSLVNKSLAPWGIYTGIPCEKMKERSKNCLKLEEEFKKNC